MKTTFIIASAVFMLLTIACLFGCAAALWFGEFWIAFCRFCAALVFVALTLWMHVTADSID